MNQDTPVIFTDGTDFFNDLSKEYIRHDIGYFILAPSGSGKTFFVSNQKDKHWIDGDDLWPKANADLTSDDWDVSFEIVKEVNNRCDVITGQAKKQGFWVIGASNYWLKPDAIVLPDWSTQKKYVLKRESTNYDGGAKEENLDGLKAHRKWIAKWESQGVPRFESIDLATKYLFDKSKTNTD